MHCSDPSSMYLDAERAMTVAAMKIKVPALQFLQGALDFWLDSNGLDLACTNQSVSVILLLAGTIMPVCTRQWSLEAAVSPKLPCSPQTPAKGRLPQSANMKLCTLWLLHWLYACTHHA